MHVILLLYSEQSGFKVKATIKKFTSLNHSTGQGIVYTLGRFGPDSGQERGRNHVDRTVAEGSIKYRTADEVEDSKHSIFVG